MGLLFRPRSLPAQHAVEAIGRRAANECADLTSLATGDAVGDLEMLSRTLARRHMAHPEAFSDIEISVVTAIVDGTGYAEWVMTARHTGRFVVDEETMVDATGARITLRGLTVADLVDDRIRSVREYVDELALLDGLGLLPETDSPIS